MRELWGDQKRVAQLVAIVRECAKAYPELTITELVSVSREVLAKRRILYGVTEFNLAIDRVLHEREHAAPVDVPRSVPVDGGINWTRVLEAVGKAGLLPVADERAIAKRRAASAKSARESARAHALRDGKGLPSYLYEHLPRIESDEEEW